MSLHKSKRCCVHLCTYRSDVLYVSAYIEAALRMSLHISEGLSIHVSAHIEAVLHLCLCTGDLEDGYQHVAETCFLYLQGKTIYYYFLQDLRVISTKGPYIPEKNSCLIVGSADVGPLSFRCVHLCTCWPSIGHCIQKQKGENFEFFLTIVAEFYIHHCHIFHYKRWNSFSSSVDHILICTHGQQSLGKAQYLRK
jgi:hypothetical protein